ncbi:MAG TPA: peptide chain release factor 2 [Longimicrobiales bacterium]|nr:peptide chain release factor 2 [Longimicrobiales bacterium]
MRSEAIFDVARKRSRIAELDQKMSEPGFWDDQNAAREVIAEVNELKQWVEPWDGLDRTVRQLAELGAMIEAEPDAELEAEWAADVESVRKEIERFEVRALLSGPDDGRDAIVTIHPGAGGTESQDWAEMLMRMYSRWASNHDYKVEILDLQAGEEAGIKSVTLELTGPHAYGYMRAEKGVHRLVRISPFDAQKRRHTSFASVFVYPVVDDEIDIEIDDGDLRIDVYRASGAGGQHVNKTSSAVRITHEPTGIVVACQNERSQFQNKTTAMKMLKAALYERELELREVEKQKVEAEKTEIGWGNQIRSYVFQPYTMVNDHRTELKVGDVQRVMNGDIDEFIEAFLKLQASRGAA